MESHGITVYKYTIVTLGEEVTVRSADFTARVYCLDDPHGAVRRPSNFNKIALLHFTISS